MDSVLNVLGGTAFWTAFWAIPLLLQGGLKDKRTWQALEGISILGFALMVFMYALIL